MNGSLRSPRSGGDRRVLRRRVISTATACATSSDSSLSTAMTTRSRARSRRDSRAAGRNSSGRSTPSALASFCRRIGRDVAAAEGMGDRGAIESRDARELGAGEARSSISERRASPQGVDRGRRGGMAHNYSAARCSGARRVPACWVAASTWCSSAWCCGAWFSVPGTCNVRGPQRRYLASGCATLRNI